MKRVLGIYIYLMTIGAAFVIQGCGSPKMERSYDLVAVEQTDSVHGASEYNGNSSYMMEITVDVPVNGSKILIDSVMTFLNKKMYYFCEWCAHESSLYEDERWVKSFRPEEVFTNDGERFLENYMKKYRPLIQDSLWCEFFGMDLKLESQTGSFVTYGHEDNACGANCSSRKYYYVFDKHDGHIVKEIISKENVKQFFEDYPEHCGLRGDWLLGWPDWEYDVDHVFENTDFGLCSDHLSIVITGVGKHYYLMKIPYSQILSYLTTEAQALVEGMGEVVFPTDAPCYSENGEVWMELDTINQALLAHVEVAGGTTTDTLTHYEPQMEIYPKKVHFIEGEDEIVYLFIYSQGHLLYNDEAMTCVLDEDGLRPAALFFVESERDSVISCMWYDQLVEASNGFPYDSLDENRFGIHYDRYTRCLYVPILESHDPGSEFADTSCGQYTGRFDVLRFDGKKFVLDGTDGAWWLRPELRDYKRTVSNKKTAEGIKQVDLMPDGTYRHTFWIGAKTLDDLRKKPDIVEINKQNVFND